uniref:Uncharacterized protein n=1 Tax=Setaria viridis TaxID=4556 RepID=A0A4U6VBJ1_SETVI|nr:hypothetical protein SEVIR_3G202900v2 [Setaria viridis]
MSLAITQSRLPSSLLHWKPFRSQITWQLVSFLAVARLASPLQSRILVGGDEIHRRLRSRRLRPATPALPGLHAESTGRSRCLGVGRQLPVPATEAAAGRDRESRRHAAAECGCCGREGQPRRRRGEPEEADAEQVESEAELAGPDEEGLRKISDDCI